MPAYEALFAQGAQSLEMVTGDVFESGALVIEIGWSTLVIQPAGAEAVRDVSKYVVVHRRQPDDTLKLLLTRSTATRHRRTHANVSHCCCPGPKIGSATSSSRCHDVVGRSPRVPMERHCVPAARRRNPHHDGDVASAEPRVEALCSDVLAKHP